jgi:transposase
MAKKKTSISERLTSGKLNRKQRKELVRRVYAEDPGLEVVHRNVAGIDVGNESHYVSVPPGRDPQPVQEFGCWTADLVRMAEWLKSCGVQTVVMQSTGVYWIGVYDVLEKAGLKVWLTNARETKNLPGRKSDVQESQWLMKLHTYGLLRNSFRPPEQIRAVRTIWRLRDRNVRDAGREVQHMQKAMTTMNVQLANVLSDVVGVSGQAIIRAILGGQRDPQELAKLRDYRVKASAEEVARSPEGNWREDILFELQQAVDRYDFCQEQIAKCDQRLEKYLAALPSRGKAPVKAPVAQAEAAADTQGAGPHPPKTKPKNKKKKHSKPRGNEPHFDLEAELYRICGVDLTTLDGVYVMTALTFVSELGTDMRPWQTEDHLVSWLKLSPCRQISGGKVIKQERNRTRNRVANALRMAASGLKDSDSYLGARFRQLRARLGPGKATKAMAAHLARLIYRMLTNGQEWVDRGTQEHEKKRVEREKQALLHKAAALGYRLEPAA